MHRKKCVILLFVIFLQAASGCLSKHSPLARQIAESRRGRILKEIKNLQDHDWAGEYYAGDGVGVNIYLSIAPQSGYVFEWRGCAGIYDRNYGKVTASSAHLRLSFTHKNSRKGCQRIAGDFIWLRWGERRYLIPPGEVDKFFNSVNQGSEPRTKLQGSYLLRKGDERKKVTGQPQLPTDFGKESHSHQQIDQGTH